ncbi:hypothetical protein Tco_0114836 [Tanacetum coccineum]
MAYSDKYKKILDVICLNKMKQDRKMKKEEEEAITKIKGEALIEKEDPGAFVIPIRLEGKINLNALADTGSDINVMPYRLYMELGRKELKNVNRGITMLNHLKAELMGLMKDVQCQTSLDTTESDSDDEEEYAIQRNKFEAPIYEQKPTQYLNCNDPMDRSLALCFNKKEEGNGQWHAEIRLTDPYGNIYDQEFVTKKTSRSELCHEFCSTYEYDEVCAADELKTKKIIKFKLCGRAFSWTLLVFAKRLGLYNLKEIEEEGFDVYFLGGLHSDEHFKSSRVLVKHQAFDTTTLRELIDFEGRLIPKVPELGLSRVVIPRPLRASMQDLYERMSCIEIRQPRRAIDYDVLYDSLIIGQYAGIIEHMLGFTNVSLQSAYNPSWILINISRTNIIQQYPPQQLGQQDDDE